MGEVEAEGEAAISAMTSSRDAVWISAAWRLLSVLGCESSTLTEMREAVVRGKLRETGKMRRGRRKLECSTCVSIGAHPQRKEGGQVPKSRLPTGNEYESGTHTAYSYGKRSLVQLAPFLMPAGANRRSKDHKGLEGSFPPAFPHPGFQGQHVQCIGYVHYVRTTYIRYIRITNPRLRCKIQGLINAPRPVICCSQFSR